jgi:hypothetical protein
MNKKRLILAFIATTPLFSWGRAQAADFSKVDLQPWIRYWYTRFDVGLPPLGDLRESYQDGSVFITKGGGVFTEGSERSNPVGLPEPFRTSIMRGIATSAERSSLALLIEQARLGVQTDCVSVTSSDQLWEYEILWYGRQGRRNEFRVFFRNQANETLPPCPRTVIAFIFNTDSLLSDVRSHRDTEVLSGGPP